MKKIVHPLGAEWQFTAPPGYGLVSRAVGRVWLESRQCGHESWRWEFALADGSGFRTGTANSCIAAKQACASCFHALRASRGNGILFSIRFFRVKQEGEP